MQTRVRVKGVLLIIVMGHRHPLGQSWASAGLWAHGPGMYARVTPDTVISHLYRRRHTGMVEGSAYKDWQLFPHFAQGLERKAFSVGTAGSKF